MFIHHLLMGSIALDPHLLHLHMTRDIPPRTEIVKTFVKITEDLLHIEEKEGVVAVVLEKK